MFEWGVRGLIFDYLMTHIQYFVEEKRFITDRVFISTTNFAVLLKELAARRSSARGYDFRLHTDVQILTLATGAGVTIVTPYPGLSDTDILYYDTAEALEHARAIKEFGNKLEELIA